MSSKFIDLQINGYNGVFFGEIPNSPDDFTQACRGIIESGVSGFLATVTTASEEIYRYVLPLLAELMEQEEFKGKLLGIHLEGPFISKEPGAVGAHRKKFCRLPDIKFLQMLIDLSKNNIRILTLAPELPNADKVTEYATKHQIVVSAGHSLATSSDLAAFVKAGGKTVTHLGNGLPLMLPRHDNFIWSVLSNDDLQVMIIADGNHLPKELIKTIIKVKGVENVVVVSDIAHLAGFPPGEYLNTGDKVILKEDGSIVLKELGCLAGSSLVLPKAADRLREMDILTDEEIEQVCYTNPLKLISSS